MNIVGMCIAATTRVLSVYLVHSTGGNIYDKLTAHLQIVGMVAEILLQHKIYHDTRKRVTP